MKLKTRIKAGELAGQGRRIRMRTLTMRPLAGFGLLVATVKACKQSDILLRQNAAPYGAAFIYPPAAIHVRSV